MNLTQKIELAKDIKYYRIFVNKMQVKEVAEISGVSKPTIYHLENPEKCSDKQPTLKVLRKIFVALKFPSELVEKYEYYFYKTKYDK